MIAGDPTWTCHACGDERPDAAISVWSTWRTIGGVDVQTNVRYCNDRPGCVEAAPGIDLMGGNRG